MSTNDPLVSILTPVYNGEKYLVECMESVLAQTYHHWEYIIVNNCSTDRTFEIAQRYAAKDQRIRVVNNQSFVDVIDNHNIAFRQISPRSKYCKVVAADDWIFPECISRMAGLAEAHTSVAIVGAYTINKGGVIWLGLPLGLSVISGREVCRMHLMGGPQVMGPPTSVLYRSEIIRSEERFFPGPVLCADEAAYYRSLQHRDFGFVHQILSFERIHDEALSAQQYRLNAFLLNRVFFLIEYGHIFLSQEEYDARLHELLDSYYEYLAIAVVNRFPGNFWNYHRNRLRQIGMQLDRRRLVKAVAGKVIDLLLNPKQTVEKILRRQHSDT